MKKNWLEYLSKTGRAEILDIFPNKDALIKFYKRAKILFIYAQTKENQTVSRINIQL